MKILYIITGKEGEPTSEETSKSIESKEGGTVTFCLYKDEVEEPGLLNERIRNCDEEFTHVCIIPNGSSLSEKFKTLVPLYATEEDAIYMPIVSYYYNPDGEEKFRGFLNSVLWKPHVVEQVGELTLSTAVKQIDTTLYGCLIPIKLFKEQNFGFATDVKYFWQFEFLNQVCKKEIDVLGIPKVLFNMTKDFELKDIDKDEKLKYFDMARAGYNLRSADELQAMLKA